MSTRILVTGGAGFIGSNFVHHVARTRPDAATFVQRERLGTAHAVLAAREAIARGADDLLVVFGDTPLISAERSFFGRRLSGVGLPQALAGQPGLADDLISALEARALWSRFGL